MCCDTDVDECAVNNGNCTEHATCINSPGTYSCTCVGGFHHLSNKHVYVAI